MSTASVLVLVAGLIAIAWINWYFFLAERSTRTAVVRGAAQEVEVQVRGGYDPAEIHLKRGLPARLIFDRQETSSCSEELVIPSLGIRRFLPPFEKTTIEITPTERGAFDITCGMSMLHGKLVVED